VVGGGVRCFVGVNLSSVVTHSAREPRSEKRAQITESLPSSFPGMVEIEVDALGVITISSGCFERCGSNNKTPP